MGITDQTNKKKKQPKKVRAMKATAATCKHSIIYAGVLRESGDFSNTLMFYGEHCRRKGADGHASFLPSFHS